MTGDYLLDTNIVIAYLNDDPTIGEKIDAAESILLPSIVAGELYFGALESRRSAQNLARVEEFADDVVTLSCDLGTARHYGAIKRQLRAIGRPIPDNDIWIAAIALQHGLTLATRDDHFDHVEGLNVVRW